MGIRHVASSANSKMFSDVDRSFMKSGPRILPCGTPEMTGKVFEVHVDCPTDTHWSRTLFVRAIAIKFHAEIP